MNRMARIVLDPNRTYAGTRTAVQLCGSHKYYHAPVKPTAATPPSGKTHPPAPPGSAPVTDKSQTKAKGKYPPKQTFSVMSISGRVPYLKSNIPMKLLTNGPNINPDDGWQNTLLDNAEPSGYVRFSG